eukprot:3735433-Amphidinium_carterae.1
MASQQAKRRILASFVYLWRTLDPERTSTWGSFDSTQNLAVPRAQTLGLQTLAPSLETPCRASTLTLEAPAYTCQRLPWRLLRRKKRKKVAGIGRQLYLVQGYWLPYPKP